MSVAELIPEIESAPSPRRFTIEEYLAMAEAGVFKPHERVQLINGEIIRMSPMGFRHADVLALLMMLLVPSVDSKRYIVRSQSPASIPPDSVPEPDISVCKRSTLGSGRYPNGDEIVLAIEVAQSSLKFDKSVKMPLYAKAGIREYWIVNLVDPSVEVFRQPDIRAHRYNESFIRKPGEKLSAEFQPDVEFAVTDFFGMGESK